MRQIAAADAASAVCTAFTLSQDVVFKIQKTVLMAI
jgi:hypothetical protein